MPEYQIYDLDQLGGVARRRFATCRNDDEAVDAARADLLGADHAEIWQAERKLGRVSGFARQTPFPGPVAGGASLIP